MNWLFFVGRYKKGTVGITCGVPRRKVNIKSKISVEKEPYYQPKRIILPTFYINQLENSMPFRSSQDFTIEMRYMLLRATLLKIHSALHILDSYTSQLSAQLGNSRRLSNCSEGSLRIITLEQITFFFCFAGTLFLMFCYSHKVFFSAKLQTKGIFVQLIEASHYPNNYVWNVQLLESFTFERTISERSLIYPFRLFDI